MYFFVHYRQRRKVEMLDMWQIHGAAAQSSAATINSVFTTAPAAVSVKGKRPTLMADVANPMVSDKKFNVHASTELQEI